MMDADSERRAFLDEVIENPDDDDPRLIYADYLEEQGDSRGEFIRVQCELAQTDPLEPEHFDLLDRNDELLDEYQQAWADELKQDVRKSVFHRGFIDTITITARKFAKQSEKLFRATPVHWLRFNYVKGAGPLLAAVPELGHIRNLDLSSLKIPREDLIALLTSKHLTSLKGLDLSRLDLPLDAEIGRSIAQSAFASTLQDITISGYQTHEDFCRTLFQGTYEELRSLAVDATYGERTRLGSFDRLHVPQLRRLMIREQLNVDVVRGLTGLPLNQLESLDLKFSRIPAEGIRLLASHGAFENLCDLNLSDCVCPVSGMDAVFQKQNLSRCEKLDLHRAVDRTSPTANPRLIRMVVDHEPLSNLKELHLVSLRSEDLRLLAEAPQLGGLKRLNAINCQLRADDVGSITDGPWRQSLRSLRLYGSQIGLDAMRGLCADVYPNLTKLDLSSDYDRQGSITEAAVVHMIQSEAFPNLRELSLGELRLSDRTLNAISAKDYFPKLRQLVFTNNTATQNVVRDVLNSEHLPRLRLLNLGGTKGMNNRPKLQKEFGNRIKT